MTDPTNAAKEPDGDQGNLTGVRVVEIGNEQGEYCGLSLAGLGADVVKIEPKEGSSTRSIGPFVGDIPHPERSLFFWAYNRGKRSVVLDLDTPEGRSNLGRLLECGGRAARLHPTRHATFTRVRSGGAQKDPSALGNSENHTVR
jgi:hypothetical protein